MKGYGALLKKKKKKKKKALPSAGQNMSLLPTSDGLS
jgi:hypothetical protein